MANTKEQVEAFYKWSLARLAESDQELAIDDLYEAWRTLNQTPEEFEDNVRAIKEALDDLDRGVPSRPWDDFNREFRAKHGI
jgi:hypothetical protein